MALRTYYDTQIKVYHLLNDHPIMNKMLTEFGIEIDQIKDVANYLIEHHDEISEMPLNNFYYESEIIETIAELYGFFPPFNNQVSLLGTPLYELLNFTIYLYKFGTVDNFYEKNILNFLPEYDREYILAEPKLKLLYESIGRKFDDIELKISQMKNIYDIDEVPEKLLDYLGQNIGYEKEDYTLKDVSFRELLKNIIEIYKIKGTNYSFSFFFKFLGFEISLKEFFFNHDVQNPEGFPGIENNRVEYYLTTKNPLIDISNNKPAAYLEKTKNINDWSLEIESLESKGCTNAIQYMLGFQPYNNNLDNPIWHSNPWTYFKTNLIEYELDPFIDKLNLTASDNETIRKYVKFLSPTYLFTWINVNLRPWVEDINIIVDSENDWNISIEKNLGDPRPTPTPWLGDKKTSADSGFNGFNNDGIYYDYEPLDEILNIYKTGGEQLRFNLENNMNLGDHEKIGTTLKRDGVYIRQPGHPKFITNITHEGDKKISFDFMKVEIRDFIDEDSVPRVNYYSDLPLSGISDEEIYYVRFTQNNNIFGYYKFYSLISEWRYISWDDYSYRSFPATPINPTPDNNQTLSESNIFDFIWEEIKGSNGYRLQVSNDSNFNNIVVDVDNLTTNSYNSGTTLFSNDRYYWRIKVKNNADFPNLPPNNPLDPNDFIWTSWSNQWQFILDNRPFPYNNEIINHETIFVTANRNLGIFGNASFNISWNNIPGSEQYRIQILENKPYVWTLREGILYSQTYSNLPIDKPLNTISYVVDEEKFYKYNTINQDWVEISQSEEYSVVDDFEDLPNSEQRIGDIWYVINDDTYYMWRSVFNEWQETNDPYGVIGNISNIDMLNGNDGNLYDIYFVQASNDFYQYVPIEQTSQFIITVYDATITNNIFPVILGNGLYYWRVQPYHKNDGWQDWGELYEFTIDFA